MTMTSDIPFTESSGNVFADLGLPDAEEALTKAELAMAIGSIIDDRHMTQQQTAEILGITQPKVSALLRGQLTGFSMERLLRFLNALGHNVRIVVEEEERTKGTLTVVSGGNPTPLQRARKPAKVRSQKTAL